jgi:hypothetical protein
MSSLYEKESSTSAKWISAAGLVIPACPKARRAACSAYRAAPHVRLERDGASVDHPIPSTHTGASVREGACAPDARTTTTAPSACREQSSTLSGVNAGAELSTSSAVASAAYDASGLSIALRRFFAATSAHCSSVLPDSSRNRCISRPATYQGWTRSGRSNTGSRANSRMCGSVTMSDAFECASTATTRAIPVRISMHPVASAIRPSAATVCTGRSAAPSWSGTYSSKMLVPSRKSSDEQTKESTLRRGSMPQSS